MIASGNPLGGIPIVYAANQLRTSGTTFVAGAALTVNGVSNLVTNMSGNLSATNQVDTASNISSLYKFLKALLTPSKVDDATFSAEAIKAALGLGTEAANAERGDHWADDNENTDASNQPPSNGSSTNTGSPASGSGGGGSEGPSTGGYSPIGGGLTVHGPVVNLNGGARVSTITVGEGEDRRTIVCVNNVCIGT
jgi:hypothetical protein